MSSQIKNPIDAQLFVNCTFDMDYLEITKNESLRKYEENVYLLGTIFSTCEKEEGKNLNNQNNFNHQLNDSNNSSMEVDQELSLSEKEILSLFNYHKHHGKKESEEFSDHFEEEKIKRIIQDLEIEIQNEEQIHNSENIISENSNISKKRILLGQLANSVKDLKEHEILLKNNKALFKESSGKFHDFYSKLRNIKLHQNEEFFSETLKAVDEAGILSETYKQQDNFLRKKHRYNCEIPFDPSSNVVIMPL
jgi:hypothetical protein